jgi:hypothetical protein
VHHDQVSKTAPTGEYLTTGSFMIRGKKNYLPPSYLVYGFGFLFKVDETSVFRHRNERRIKTIEDDNASVVALSESSVAESATTDLRPNNENDHELSDHESVSDGESTDEDKLLTNDNDEHALSMTTIAEESDVTQVSEAIQTGELNKVDTAIPETSKPAKNGLDDFFPDTNIQLHHVKGDKFVLQRDVRTSVVTSVVNDDKEEDENIYLGDDRPIVLGEKVKVNRISAKQRRQMKKGKQTTETECEKQDDDQEQSSDTEEVNVGTTSATSSTNKVGVSQPVVQPKRGQKSKLKRVKDLYGDQDEEERRIKMELLASAGAPKELKSKKGGKGGKQQQVKGRNMQQQQAGKKGAPVKLSKEQLVVETPVIDSLSVSPDVAVADDGQEKLETAGAEHEDDAQDDEPSQTMQVDDILDTLTGQPVADDILLFCLPVCAPYAALTSYKYKVKLIPGTTKRGKAAKLAVNMFVTDKATTAREKDLFKSLKDTDLSRNMPGKVKVSSNVHKTKHK